MAMNRMSAFWGLIIGAVGLVFLGINFGWWSANIWTVIWEFWPVILILVGIRLLTKNTAAFFLISLAVLALVAWALAANAMNGNNTFFDDLRTERNVETSTFTASVDASNSDTFTLDLGGQYTVKITSGTTVSKVTTEFTGPKDVTDGLSLNKENNTITLKDRDINRSFRFFSWFNNETTGTITIPASVALRLNVSGVTDTDTTGHKGTVTVDGSGATTVRFHDSEATNPDISLSGSGKVILDTCTGDAIFKLSGAAEIEAHTCTLNKLTADLSGAGDIKIENGSIVDSNIKASGASNIRIPKPSGKDDRDTSGAAEIQLND